MTIGHFGQQASADKIRPSVGVPLAQDRQKLDLQVKAMRLMHEGYQHRLPKASPIRR